jgi:hypothetical protein
MIYSLQHGDESFLVGMVGNGILAGMKNETYTIQLQPIAGGFLVTVKELGITLEVQSTRQDDALDAAHNAIIDAIAAQREEVSAKAS